MATTTIRDAAEYESRLQQYYFERAEEARAVRVGEKEVSEQAAIVSFFPAPASSCTEGEVTSRQLKKLPGCYPRPAIL